MKLAILGATGRTGQALLRHALEAGHHVTAVVRDPERLPGYLRTHLTVLTAAAFAPELLTPAVVGRDAVLNVTGPRDLGEASTVCTDSTAAALTAMAQTDSNSRFVLASNSAMHPGAGDDPLTRYFVKPVILARVLRHLNTDAREAERLVRASTMEWTIVRAGRLTDAAGKGRFRAAPDRNIPGGFQITRTDFAQALLEAASDPTAAGHALAVAN
ncbi:SDR family oxidoreductase [Glycomyces endophyticus]|uniref:SDR family oxidoreductase n=1 Tax=Glycomyces endophyticus TaxID=480996 RepID=A0ABP4TUE3_9ACTN